MIPRYSRPQMAAIWAPENRLRIWFEIEAHACDAMAELGIIPRTPPSDLGGGKKAMAALKANPAANVEKSTPSSEVTKHDVIRLHDLAGRVHRPAVARFVHQG
jgi:adenylosuccinate lyase